MARKLKSEPLSKAGKKALIKYLTKTGQIKKSFVIYTNRPETAKRKVPKNVVRKIAAHLRKLERYAGKRGANGRKGS